MAVTGKRKRSSQKASKPYYQVKNLNRLTLKFRIKTVMKMILNNRRVGYPQRIETNLVYLANRVCMKKDLNLSMLTKSKSRKMYVLLAILLKLTKKKNKNKWLSKRGIFYKDKETFETQRQFDELMDDACCILGATSRCLKIKGVTNGLAIGSLVIKENGKVFDLLNFNTFGKCISPYMFDFEIVSCDAQFVLVVDKEATYSTLVEDNFHKKVRCVMITGSDCDLTGIEIMCTYTCGSDNLAFDSKNMATPNIKWLGVRPSDWDKYELTSGVTDLSHDEEQAASKFRSKSFLKHKPLWRTEIKKMMNLKKKCELDSLTSKVVLHKLAIKDWLPGS